MTLVLSRAKKQHEWFSSKQHLVVFGLRVTGHEWLVASEYPPTLGLAAEERHEWLVVSETLRQMSWLPKNDVSDQ